MKSLILSSIEPAVGSLMISRTVLLSTAVLLIIFSSSSKNESSLRDFIFSNMPVFEEGTKIYIYHNNGFNNIVKLKHYFRIMNWPVAMLVCISMSLFFSINCGNELTALVNRCVLSLTILKAKSLSLSSPIELLSFFTSSSDDLIMIN